MNIKKVYDYNSNILDFTRKDGIRYKLNLRGSITVIDGNSGTGKTLLVSELFHLKKSGENLTGLDLSNIVILKSFEDKIEDEKKLYILDRADKVLNDDMCDTICSCKNAHFLIFARGSYNLGISPNHFGTLQRNENNISIVYDFNEKWW